MSSSIPLIGHKAIQAQLSRLAELSDGPQSFLFVGPRHVGKRFMAEWFAKLLVTGEPVSQGMLSDLLIIEPELVTTAKSTKLRPIPIDAIRSLQHFLSRTPLSGKKRVVIIDEAEELGPGGANALLKVLEEPPQNSALILIATERERLLPTLLSRLVPITFRPVPREELQQALPEANALPQFFFDLGLPGIVIQALEEAALFGVEKEELRNLFQLSRLSLRSRLALAETLAQNERRAKHLLELWCIGLVFQARAKTEGEASGRYTFLHIVTQTLKTLSEGSGNNRQVLERLFLSLP